jgi:hypothetical protein
MPHLWARSGALRRLTKPPGADDTLADRDRAIVDARRQQKFLVTVIITHVANGPLCENAFVLFSRAND